VNDEDVVEEGVDEGDMGEEEREWAERWRRENEHFFG
jgi:hypothetical protein